MLRAAWTDNPGRSGRALARPPGQTYRGTMAGLVSLVRRVRMHLSPPPPEPSGPAIEELAAALRRVRPLVLAPAPGTPMARRRGTTAAYDDLLGQAARALGVPDLLTDLREGTDREAERLRLEHLLREAGLVLDQPRSDRR